MADIDWSNFPREVIPYNTFLVVSTVLITAWEYNTQIEPLIRFGQVELISSAYPIILEIVPFIFSPTPIATMLDNYIGDPFLIITIQPFITQFGVPVVPVQIVPYGNGCPKWQYWG